MTTDKIPSKLWICSKHGIEAPVIGTFKNKKTKIWCLECVAKYLHEDDPIEHISYGKILPKYFDIFVSIKD